MEDGDTGKYLARSLIQDFVFSSRKMGCIRCISAHVYNKCTYMAKRKKRDFKVGLCSFLPRRAGGLICSL